MQTSSETHCDTGRYCRSVVTEKGKMFVLAYSHIPPPKFHLSNPVVKDRTHSKRSLEMYLRSTLHIPS